MPRRRGHPLLIALVAGTAALAAIVAFAGTLLFSGPGNRSGQAAAAEPRSAARTPAAPAYSTGLWNGTWAAAPVSGVVDPYLGVDRTRRVIRNVVHTSIGGDAARVTFSNLFGTHPLLIDGVTVNTHPATFRGLPSVTVAAGRQVVSDPVVLPVAADADLAVTLRTPTARGPVTLHPNAHQTSYVQDARGTWRTQEWRYLTAVDVRNPKAAGTVVVIGDSLTAGTGSGLDVNGRWPDILADRVGGMYGVVNKGIAGNRILRDGYGPRALDRFERDVLGTAGVKTVVIALGINDVQKFPQETDPRRITDGLRSLTERAHARGLRVVGATLMPFQGFPTWDPARNAVREQVNTVIRAGGIFDSVLDFDEAARDPFHPNRLLPAYDSGDHLHLNDSGYQRLGSLVDPASLRNDRPSSDQL